MIEKVATIVKKGEEKSDTEYWRSRPIEERIAMVEELRRDYYGDDYDKDGIAKVFKIVKRVEKTTRRKEDIADTENFE